MRPLIRTLLCTALSWVLCGGTTFGQWVEQQVELQPGWNSVYLEFDPGVEDADALFAGQPIAAVWTRASQPLGGLPQDCTGPNDPNCAPLADTLWRSWVPPGDPARPTVNLRVIRGGRVYLIHALAPIAMTIAGRPNGQASAWRRGFNLAGFHVEPDPSAAPTFDAYLGPSPAHSSREIYSLDSSAELLPVPSSSRIVPGRGYWVSANSDSEYDGPVAIDPVARGGITFGKHQTTSSITLTNLASDPRDVNGTYEPSAPVPVAAAMHPTNAGNVPLHWLNYGQGGVAEQILQWEPLGTQMWSLTPDGQPGARRTVRLGVQRTGLAPASLDVNLQGSQYQGILKISDGSGFRRLLPTTAEVVGTPVVTGASAASAVGSVTVRPGLYVGTVSVNSVAWVTAGARLWTNNDPNAPVFADNKVCFGGADSGAGCQSDSDCDGGTCSGSCLGGPLPGGACSTSADCADGGAGPDGVCTVDTDAAALRPVPSPFEFRVILHISGSVPAEYKLLTEVALLKDAIGNFVLATPDCDPALCDTLTGALTVDGVPFARRISTIAFSFDSDLLLSGAFAPTLAGTTTLLPDDPLNPFRHKFHPDHDCDQPGECFEVTRALSFTLEPQPPPGESILDWGDSVLGGVYQEQISGLHKDALDVRGRFELRRLSDIDVLNTVPASGGAR